MPESIQAIEDASPETQEILKELQAEGNEIGGPKPEEPQKEDPKPEAAKQKDDGKPDEGKPKENDQEPSADGQKKPEDQSKPADRTARTVPVGIHNDERHKRQDAERRAEEAERKAAELEAKLSQSQNNQPPTQENQDEVREVAKKLAEKHNLDADFVTEFADTIAAIASKRNVLPKEISEQLKTFQDLNQKAQADAAERERIKAQDEGFNNEFSKLVEQMPEVASLKEELKQRAFEDGYIKAPLRTIAIEYLHDNPPGRKTFEGGNNGRTENAEVIDFANITEEQFKNLSDDQFDKYLAWKETDERAKRLNK